MRAVCCWSKAHNMLTGDSLVVMAHVLKHRVQCTPCFPAAAITQAAAAAGCRAGGCWTARLMSLITAAARVTSAGYICQQLCGLKQYTCRMVYPKAVWAAHNGQSHGWSRQRRAPRNTRIEHLSAVPVYQRVRLLLQSSMQINLLLAAAI